MQLKDADWSYIRLQDIAETATATPAPAPVKPGSRPQAFSDSFLIIPPRTYPVSPVLEVPFSAFRPRFDCAWWAEKVISICLHISLISLFETVFFFAYISRTEDTALLRAVGGFVGGFEDTCATWPAAETAVIRDIVGTLVNSSVIAAAATASVAQRYTYNAGLERQAWAYFGGLAGATTLLIAVSAKKRYKIQWRRICAENVALVGLLGIYEFLFFRTIVYNYTSLSAAELKWDALQQVNASCAIF
jgi:hypothetical protein